MKAFPDADLWSFGTEFHRGLFFECGGTTVYSKIGDHANRHGYRQWIILTDYAGF